MKRLVTIICIMSAIVAGSVYSLFWLKNYSEETAAQLSVIADTAQSDPQKASEELEKLQREWDKTKSYIGVFVHEAPLNTFSECLEECKALLRQEYSDEFQVKIEKAVSAVADIYKNELPTLENVL